MEQALIDAGYRLYHGNDVDIYFNQKICQHAGKCVRGDSRIFKLERKPWIVPDNADVATVMQVIDQCPSGALVYRTK
ncbi:MULTISPECIES: (4Fe-4S)-binding protein [Silvimonas]|uniref:(4Fe-4S)-binding protein n=1 Tax=Silvimonas TaxID=300264 RepID=UPI0024B389DE|nr:MULTISPECIES: (4Fe-4S)-binding protein [Silvimonas]MDR3430164.1 (4Fe-4S)-binding protein [Silvimonas sp.]